MKNSFVEILFHEFNRKSILKIVILITLFTVLPVLVTNSFWLHVLILIFMYGVLGLSWNFIGGYTGQVSFMQAIFFGIGAYTSTVLSTKFGVNPWLGMFVGSCIAVIISSIIGIPTFRLKGPYFTIATLALGVIFGNLARRWAFMGGARGLYIPMKEEGLINFQFNNKVGYYYIAFGLIVFAILLTYMVQRSKLGYYFRAIKGNDIAAKSVGIDVPKFKLIAFGLSAFIAALAGTFYAQYTLYIDPESVLSEILSLQACFIVVLGGVGTTVGPLLGAVILILLWQLTNAYFGGAKAIHLLIYGALIVLIMIFEPDGLLAIYKKLYKRVVKT
ncbi:MAG: branched-chain amino acid ABC transporter permease [Candidatus Atribacteria bacterium]|jgi:branched-chain amino acid transport system permease protein|nr:branched-chain amino acid ABC transporter permease [Candidatus Atribacteria bacterium]